MEEFILKNRTKIIRIASLGLIWIFVVGAVILTGLNVLAVENENIVVTAIVEAWLSFEVSPTSTQLSPSLVNTVGDTFIGSSTAIDIKVGTNNTGGWQVKINGANDGLTSGGNSITSVNITSTLSAGTTGYGANATSTLSGASIGSYYNYYGTETVGEIKSGAGQILATKNSANTLQSAVDMVIKAAADPVTIPPASNYTDTITLTATTSF